MVRLAESGTVTVVSSSSMFTGPTVPGRMFTGGLPKLLPLPGTYSGMLPDPDVIIGGGGGGQRSLSCLWMAPWSKIAILCLLLKHCKVDSTIQRFAQESEV